MVAATCIQKIRKENGRIQSYILQDIQGKVVEISAIDLKQAMQNNQISVVNLRLTKDNRIANTKVARVVYLTNSLIKKINCTKTLSFKSNVYIDTIKSKASIVGSKFTQLEKGLYLLENSTSLVIVSNRQIKFKQDSSHLFERTDFASIDLREVDTSEAVTMNSMFCYCGTKSIDFSNFNTSNVEGMSSMFYRCEAKELDLRSFNTSKVVYMNYMFMESRAKSINISNFDTHNVQYMIGMFEDCSAHELDLSNFNTKSVKDMSRMFKECKFNELDIRNFDTHRVTNMNSMFECAEIEKINVSSFYTGNVTNMKSMFNSCKTSKLDLSNFDTSYVKDIQSMFRSLNADELIIKTFRLNRVAFASFMFEMCSVKKTIDLRGLTIEHNMCGVYNMFNKCNSKIISNDAKIIEQAGSRVVKQHEV